VRRKETQQTTHTSSTLPTLAHSPSLHTHLVHIPPRTPPNYTRALFFLAHSLPLFLSLSLVQFPTLPLYPPPHHFHGQVHKYLSKYPAESTYSAKSAASARQRRAKLEPTLDSSCCCNQSARIQVLCGRASDAQCCARLDRLVRLFHRLVRLFHCLVRLLLYVLRLPHATWPAHEDRDTDADRDIDTNTDIDFSTCICIYIYIQMYMSDTERFGA